MPVELRDEVITQFFQKVIMEEVINELMQNKVAKIIRQKMIFKIVK